MLVRSPASSTPANPASLEEIVERGLCGDPRALLLGPPGIGKTTLAARLAASLAPAGRLCRCLSADPGSPGFGVPGAVCLGEWRDGVWRLLALEALCSLNAGRFRLPLVAAARRLARTVSDGVLLVDAPGVVRGAAGAELLQGLLEAVGVDRVLVLTRDPETLPLANELTAAGVERFTLLAAPQARRPGKGTRARLRTRLWDTYLAQARELVLDPRGMSLTGTPPPLAAEDVWRGRQVALLARGRTLALGEVLGLEEGAMRVLIPPLPRFGAGEVQELLVRDVGRTDDGRLNSIEPFAARTLEYVPPSDILPYAAPGDSGGPRPLARVGAAVAVLVNGVFGDPMLHLRLRQQRRSLLFDLGEGARLPARLAHQVTDVFISHAHIDHIGGFFWLLRSRLAQPLSPCRLVGPPGLAGHIDAMIRGICWDRIGDRGPSFEIAELHGGQLRRWRVQVGVDRPEVLQPKLASAGVVLEESDFRVRALTLDHGVPVLAFAFEAGLQVRVRDERLGSLGLPPGPWLRELKRLVAAGQLEALLELPGGRVRPVRDLARLLLRVTPGPKLVYATDLADTPGNRERLIGLARGAHTLFCEARFLAEDAARAARTGHLTARACGEIAQAAQVGQLVPFHFSRRYDAHPHRIYTEVQAMCSHVPLPASLRWKDG